MRTNLGNCGIVGNSGGGAALKGDHLDIEEKREKRKVGIYIYIYIRTRIDFSPKLSEPISTGPVHST